MQDSEQQPQNKKMYGNLSDFSATLFYWLNPILIATKYLLLDFFSYSVSAGISLDTWIAQESIVSENLSTLMWQLLMWS